MFHIKFHFKIILIYLLHLLFIYFFRFKIKKILSKKNTLKQETCFQTIKFSDQSK